MYKRQTYGGMLGKVYAEILESTDNRPAQALLATGSSRSAALLYGLLPGAAQELTSYTVYRWECAVRASVVMGFVGAGGLGQLMDQSMKMLAGGEAASILSVFTVSYTHLDVYKRQGPVGGFQVWQAFQAPGVMSFPGSESSRCVFTYKH